MVDITYPPFVRKLLRTLYIETGINHSVIYRASQGYVTEIEVRQNNVQDKTIIPLADYSFKNGKLKRTKMYVYHSQVVGIHISTVSPKYINQPLPNFQPCDTCNSDDCKYLGCWQK